MNYCPKIWKRLVLKTTRASIVPSYRAKLRCANFWLVCKQATVTQKGHDTPRRALKNKIKK